MANEKKITTRKEARLVDRRSMATGEVRTTSPTSRQVQSRLLGDAGRKAGLSKTELKTAKSKLPPSTVKGIESKSNAVASRAVTARDANNVNVVKDRLSQRSIQSKAEASIKRSLDAEFAAKRAPASKVKVASNVIANTAKSAGGKIASDAGRVIGGKALGAAALVMDEQPSFQEMKRTRADIVPAYRNRSTPPSANRWVVGKDGSLRFVAGKK
jgi:hypothetical protein